MILTVEVGEVGSNEQLVLNRPFRPSIYELHIVHDLAVEVLPSISYTHIQPPKGSTHNVILRPLRSNQLVPVEHGLDGRPGLPLAFIHTHGFLNLPQHVCDYLDFALKSAFDTHGLRLHTADMVGDMIR